jgi:nucleoid-associated protein YgaU
MYAAGFATQPLRSAHRGGGRVHGLGRWVLVSGVLVAVSLALARVAAGDTAPVERVVVRPGDTLWSIAAARYPADDPRERVDAIERLNGLSGPTIVVGESLLLPPRD